jgi:hypothetical protein
MKAYISFVFSVRPLVMSSAIVHQPLIIGRPLFATQAKTPITTASRLLYTNPGTAARTQWKPKVKGNSGPLRRPSRLCLAIDDAAFAARQLLSWLKVSQFRGPEVLHRPRPSDTFETFFTAPRVSPLPSATRTLPTLQNPSPRLTSPRLFISTTTSDQKDKRTDHDQC